MSSPAFPLHRPAPRTPSSTARTRSVDRRAAGPPTGRYRFDATTGSWWWSPEMRRLLGLDSAVEPCTETLLDAQHPDDVARVRDALGAACADGRTFALETRVLHPTRGQRAVVLLGEPVHGEGGAVRGVEGVCADVTGARPADPVAGHAEALQTEIAQLRTAMASRAVIEQAKGILMLLTHCGEQTAFDLLAHMSSHTHRKVRDVAAALTGSAAGHARLPGDLAAILRDACPPARPMH
ncbi:PAS and ANTAR domain-containing protein [Blastococcus saxobsidens]|uniref:PAS domain-containing protein n=1 Tax=Blastococcus saxobsidens TaxID=138336 RepID=A0A4Q7YBL5_9ACTN|nr:PAS and ANTAR domain-containing protein [Blastococcus saxobsidens]RZU34268.1 PAS domain-containing protein [Blastococcus saxobsidens]